VAVVQQRGAAGRALGHHDLQAVAAARAGAVQRQGGRCGHRSERGCGGWMDGRMDGWMDGGARRWMDGRAAIDGSMAGWHGDEMRCCAAVRWRAGGWMLREWRRLGAFRLLRFPRLGSGGRRGVGRVGRRAGAWPDSRICVSFRMDGRSALAWVGYGGYGVWWCGGDERWGRRGVGVGCDEQ
jgi:hypothetical protein